MRARGARARDSQDIYQREQPEARERQTDEPLEASSRPRARPVHGDLNPPDDQPGGRRRTRGEQGAVRATARQRARSLRRRRERQTRGLISISDQPHTVSRKPAAWPAPHKHRGLRWSADPQDGTLGHQSALTRYAAKQLDPAAPEDEFAEMPRSELIRKILALRNERQQTLAATASA